MVYILFILVYMWFKHWFKYGYSRVDLDLSCLKKCYHLFEHLIISKCYENSLFVTILNLIRNFNYINMGANIKMMC